MSGSSAETVRYGLEPGLSAEAFVAVLEASGLAERRPVSERARIARMLAEADLIVTARAGERLVGVSRAITDHAFCCYLSDLAVDRAWQGRGIGRMLVERTWDEAGRGCALILLAAPGAAGYYAKIGMIRHPACFLYERES